MPTILVGSHIPTANKIKTLTKSDDDDDDGKIRRDLVCTLFTLQGPSWNESELKIYIHSVLEIILITQK
jgi:hypothetical protein